LKHHHEGNYEEATCLGVPLLDEIAKHLYRGKTFTTKRATSFLFFARKQEETTADSD